MAELTGDGAIVARAQGGLSSAGSAALEGLRRLTPSRQGMLVLVLALLVTTLITGLLLREVWYRVQITKLGYQMTELTRERQRLVDERKKIQVEETVQGRTERLDRVSEDGLGLKPLHREQIIKVSGARGVVD